MMTEFTIFYFYFLSDPFKCLFHKTQRIWEVHHLWSCLWAHAESCTGKSGVKIICCVRGTKTVKDKPKNMNLSLPLSLFLSSYFYLLSSQCRLAFTSICLSLSPLCIFILCICTFPPFSNPPFFLSHSSDPSPLSLLGRGQLSLLQQWVFQRGEQGRVCCYGNARPCAGMGSSSCHVLAG